jgi:integrase
MAPKSINNYVSPMKAMLKAAVQKQLLASDPTAYIRRLRVPRPDVDPFSPEEIAQFLTMVTPHYRTYFHLAFLTGMRPPTSRSRSSGGTSILCTAKSR